MKYWYLLIVAVLCSWLVSYAHAQAPNGAVALAPTIPPAPSDSCATADPTEQEMQALPWYGDTLYLAHYYDSLRTALDGAGQARIRQYGVEDVWLRIPVQFWVYTDGGAVGSGNVRLPRPRDYQAMMDSLNNAFRRNDIKVRFYMLCPRIENDADAVTINNATEKFAGMAQ